MRSGSKKLPPCRYRQPFYWSGACCNEHIPLEKTTGTLQDGDLVIMKNMIGFIQKNYMDRISLSEIAAAGMVRAEQML